MTSEALSDLERAREALGRARVECEASPSDAAKSAYLAALDAFISAGDSRVASLESQLVSTAIRMKASGVAPASGSSDPEAVTFRRMIREHGFLVAELESYSAGKRPMPFVAGIGGETDPRATCEQSFDGGTAAVLPLGWTSTTQRGRVGTPLWTAVEDGADSGVFAVGSPALDSVTDGALDSPGLPVEVEDASVAFRANFDIERSFDGMVLEISIDGSTFRDIIEAGGAFASNGYNGRIRKGFGSQIAGRPAWTGNSGGYVTVGVTLPADAAGKTIVLRWRLVTDYGVAGRGATIDTLTSTGVRCAAAKAPPASSEAPNVPTTFSFTGPAVAIPDGAGAEVPGSTVMANLVVSGLTGVVSDVNFRFDGATCSTAAGSTTVGLDHTFVGDLVLVLRSPTGTMVTIVNRLSSGGGGNSGNNFCQTLLDDSGSTAIQSQLSAAAPFTGTFFPANALSGFNGEDPNGTWQLLATDFFVGDTGNIRAFSLVIDTVPACTITCPANVTVPESSPGSGSAVVNYPAPSTTGMCGTVTCTPPSGSSFPVGTTTVNCSTTAGPSCSFTVTVTAGCSITCPANITVSNTAGQCGAVVNYPAPTATVGCGTVTCSPASGSTFPVGTTTVNCSTVAGPTCSFTVTVNDTEAPTITCPANIMVGNATGQCSAVVTYTTPTATDNCPGATVVCVPASGSTFPVGTTMVTCTATDASMNTAACSFTVTVNDTQPPSITCPANIAVPASTMMGTTPGAIVNYAAPVVSDNCPGVGAPVCAPASGSFFPVGVTTVTCSVTDAMANTSMCSFTITVGTPFGVCIVNDGPVSERDTLKIVTEPTSALYRFWQYTDVSTGTIYQGYAEYLVYTPGRSLVAYDHDSLNVRMDMRVDYARNSATATVKNLITGVQFTLKDRLILDDPACQ